MFFFRKLFGLFFIGLLIFGLFGAFGRGSSGRYETAYRQGFYDGQQAATSSGEAGSAKTAVPDGMPGTAVYYHDRSFFFPGFGFLLLCLVPLFAFGMMASCAGKRRHHGRGRPGRACGPGHGPWQHGSWEWGSWGAEESGPSEKSPEDIDDGPPEQTKYA